MPNRNLTCIICPMGCPLEITLDEDSVQSAGSPKVLAVTGNACKRGPEYAQKELLNPTRTLTSTIAVLGGEMALVPVKTAAEIPKDTMMNCMEVIRRTVCPAPIKRADVLIRDILGTGVDVIACADVGKS